jgi:hypothetical protein
VLVGVSVTVGVLVGVVVGVGVVVSVAVGVNPIVTDGEGVCVTVGVFVGVVVGVTGILEDDGVGVTSTGGNTPSLVKTIPVINDVEYVSSINQIFLV